MKRRQNSIFWKNRFPRYMQPVGYIRLLLAQYQYFPHFVRVSRNPFRWTVDGHYLRLAALHNKHAGQRCFVIANGPSLSRMDIPKLKNEITIGCNGIYKEFDQWGMKTTYYVTEDMEQTELRASEIRKLTGTTKLAALHNAYVLGCRSGFTYFNCGAKCTGQYWNENYPQFSKDFASVVYLGNTVTYIMLQLAFFLGCDPVYIIGLDFNYGVLPQLFPPGKIEITEDNIHLVRGLHVRDDYYRVGDLIGVPAVQKQEKAFRHAKDVFEANGRSVLNAGKDSCIDVFEKVEFDSIQHWSRRQ
ncbi:MAG: DUF115 domain-containing protein [Kiritimatiellae bacterium]|nr:DUF115 domain-containing protein [Kiritimatiellia bacterium]